MMINDRQGKKKPLRRSGYSRIALWVKRRFGDRIVSVGKTQDTTELGKLAGEASAGLSAKTRKGFLEYLKAQNYKELLK